MGYDYAHGTRGQNLAFAIGVGLLLCVACEGDAALPHAWLDVPAPPLTIVLPDTVTARLVLDSARWIHAPPIKYMAIVQLDPGHATSIVVPEIRTPSLLSITPGRHVRGGDTLAMLRDTTGGGRIVVLSRRGGEWSPRRHSGEHVRTGEELGVIQHEGRFVALGNIEAAEIGMVSIGDSAIMVLPGPGRVTMRGRVMSVVTSSYGAEVGVHFHELDGALPVGSLVEVSAFPSGARDSVLATPAGSIAELTRGLALFMPAGRDRFTVRFVFADRHSDKLSVVHRGLDRPGLVATLGLAPLIAAAEDSIRTRASRPR